MSGTNCTWMALLAVSVVVASGAPRAGASMVAASSSIFEGDEEGDEEKSEDESKPEIGSWGLEMEELNSPRDYHIEVLDLGGGRFAAFGLNEVSGEYFVQRSAAADRVVFEATGSVMEHPLASGAERGNTAALGFPAPIGPSDSSYAGLMEKLASEAAAASFTFKMNGMVRLASGCILYWSVCLEIEAGGDPPVAAIIRAIRGLPTASNFRASGSLGTSLWCPPNTPAGPDGSGGQGTADFSLDLAFSAGSSGDSIIDQIVAAIGALTA